MDEAVAAQLTTDLVAGTTDSAARLFLDNGGRPPVVIWRPRPADLDLPQLAFLLRYWEGLPRQTNAPGPHLKLIDPLEMRDALGFVTLIDILDEGTDFLYRVYGTRIAERYGADLTGRRTSETDNGSYAAAFLVAIYRAVLKRAEPVFSEHYPSPRSSTAKWSRVALPLVGDSGRIERFLAGIVAGPWRPPRTDT
jgi:hypothetical protein